MVRWARRVHRIVSDSPGVHGGRRAARPIRLCGWRSRRRPGSMVPTEPRRGTTSHLQPHRTAPATPVPIGADTIGLMRIVVVGAGVMGSWTALWLRRGGHAVTLVDRHGPGNQLGSSGDESRITRSSHGADRHYPVWQRRALEPVAGARARRRDEAVRAGGRGLARERGADLRGRVARGAGRARDPGRAVVHRRARGPRAGPEPGRGPVGACSSPRAARCFARPAVVATLGPFRGRGRRDRRRARRAARRPVGGALGRVRLDDGGRPRGRCVRLRLRRRGCPSCSPTRSASSSSRIARTSCTSRSRPVTTATPRARSRLDRLRGLVLRLPVVRRGRG